MKTYPARILFAVAAVVLLPLAAWAQPTFIAQPQNTNVTTLGAAASFSATASGTAPMLFQWRKNGVTIPGQFTNVATSPATAKLTISSVLATNAGSYSVVVSNANGAVASAAALLSVSAISNLPASDAFATRGSLGVNGSGQRANTTATKEAGEPDHAGIPGGGSLWLNWTAPTNGVVTFDTRGSGFDTLLAVYTGTNVGGLTPVVGDDDRGGFLNSTVSFNATAGVSYAIALDGFFGARGNCILNWAFTATTDQLAVILTQPASATVAANTTVALQVSVSPTGLTPTYQWLFNGNPIAGATSPFYFATITDTSVGNYSCRLVTAGQSSLTNFSSVASVQINSQDSGVNPSSAANNKLALAANPGSGLGGYSGQQIFTTIGATKEPGEPVPCGQPGGASAWYAYRAPDSGVLTVDTIGSSFDAVLAVYTGSSSNYASLTALGCNVASAVAGGATMTLNVTNGATYFIAVEGVGGATGLVKLNYNCAPTFTNPPVITSQPPSQSASVGDFLLLCGTASGLPPVYFQWRLNGVNIPNETNSCLTFQTLDETNGGTYSFVTFNGGGATSSTNIVLLLTNILAHNFTDAYSNSVALPTIGTGVRRANNTTATREPNEPTNHGGKPGKASVWTTWTAPYNGIATFDTRGSGYDTTMSVYTNGSQNGGISSLGLVASGDDDSGGFLCSSVSFNAVDGVDYHIAVDGFYSERGNIALRWNEEVTSDLLPIIKTQPQSLTVSPGGNVAFDVQVNTNNPNIESVNFVWQRNGVDLITSGNGNALAFSNATLGDVGLYTVKIIQRLIGSNKATTNRSAAAQLQLSTTDATFNPNVLAQYKFRDISDNGSGAFPRPFPQIGAPAAGYSGSQIFSTFGAVKEPGEPNHCGEAGGASYWFSYQPPASGTVTVDALTATFNHLIAVYTSTDLTNFAALVSINCSSTNPATGHEITTFNGTGGTVYYIVADGVGGASGTINLAYALAAPPAVTGQPGGLTVNQTSNASFSVSASGSATLKYQWRLNTTNNVLNATNATLTVTNCQPTNAGNYNCVITNTYGATTSSVVTLTVRTAIVISNQPANLTVLAGSNSTFTVVAGGTSPAYQWRFNTTNNLVNATNASLTVTNAQSTNAGNYTVVITNAVNSVTSTVATLTVNVPPSITNQPASQTVVQSSNVSLTVGASGSAPLAYQWRTNGNNFTGRTANPLTLTNFQSTNEGSYDVIVTNSYGAVTSASATLFLIASNTASRFTNWSYATNSFITTLLGSPLSNYAVLTSTNTTNWTAISTNNSVTGIIPLTVTNSQGYTNLLFRARTP
ncbi:MAG: hypothetical protein RLZZ350_406 [Verrucomicrobiota bacterium]